MTAAQLMRKTLGGIQSERGLVHEMQLMVMHSNVIACWRNLRQACRNQQRIRPRSYAGVIAGKVICSCPMLSNANVCWPGLLKPIACGQAFDC
jgi:hypothetical protein